MCAPPQIQWQSSCLLTNDSHEVTSPPVTDHAYCPIGQDNQKVDVKVKRKKSEEAGRLVVL